MIADAALTTARTMGESVMTLYPVLHYHRTRSHGIRQCPIPLFYTTRLKYPGDILFASDVVFRDGSRPQSKDRIHVDCIACGRPLFGQAVDAADDGRLKVSTAYYSRYDRARRADWPPHRRHTARTRVLTKRPSTTM